MSKLNLDLNIDKHNHPTLVIECPECKHEFTHKLATLTTDSVMVCDACQHEVSLTNQDLSRANKLYAEIVK